MPNPFKVGFTKALDALRRLANPGQRHLSQREKELLLAPYQAKQKLGRSFFTKRLAPKVRAQRVKSLTSLERAIARDRGWI